MSDLDSLVADVLAVTPKVVHAESTGYYAAPERLHEEPPDVELAAKQAAAVLRWLAVNGWPNGHLTVYDAIAALADELDPPKETNS